MKYAVYENKVATNIQWLNEIPTHWSVERLKTAAMYCVSNVDKVPADDEMPVRLCNYTDVYYNDLIAPDMGLMETTATVEEIRKFGLLVNDVVITKDSEDWRDIAVAAMVAKTAPDLVCGYHLAIVRPRADKIYGPFLLRLFQSSAVNQQFQIAASGVTRYGLPKSAIGEAWLPLPPFAEQQTIARFLDAKTAQIDELIDKKRQLIAKLKEKRQALIARTVTRGLPPEVLARHSRESGNPGGADWAPACAGATEVTMKDSGVDWLGQIPVHWTAKAVRYIFRNCDSRRIPLSSEERADLEKLYPYYGASGVIDMVDGYLFEEPLILVAEDGSNLLSRSTPLAFLATGKYWVNNHAHILKSLTGDIRYWVATLETFDFSPLITGAAQPKLTADRLVGIRLPVPPAAEQTAIADYLVAKTKELDALVRQAVTVIDRLTEYRQALITSAVTGKIDVRGFRHARTSSPNDFIGDGHPQEVADALA